MVKKIHVLAAALVLSAFVVAGCSRVDNAPPQPAEDEIQLQIQLDLKEDIGLLLHNYVADGETHSGGMSHADKSPIKHDERIIDTLEKQQFENPAGVDHLTIQFTVVTEYCDPNYDNVYPEEFMIPMDAIALKANFGETYHIRIRGDKTNGYRAVLEG